ncbi:MAG: L,D-transpeptidase [Burkholderiales bacterium]|nr:L,D-transpeptidase [Burkholderiales bacterium]
MRAARLSRAALALLLASAAAAAQAQAITTPQELATAFAGQVRPRLELPVVEQAAYAALLDDALRDHGVRVTTAQIVVLVDRSAFVQAAMLWWLAPGQAGVFIGAAPASTGRPSGFEHFETPLGVFEHTLANLDFRAEGTLNSIGIRGYGDKGMRVFDFGWVMGRRGWAPGEQLMRLQLHATDRRWLEPRLGRRESKGCIRIPATLNRFIDHYGLLDAAYDDAIAAGRSFWVLRDDRQPTPWPGRYLVVIESARSARPAWSPAPGERRVSAAEPGPGTC